MSWDDKTPQDIMADFSALLREVYAAPITEVDRLWLPYDTYRWLMRGRIVAMLSKKPRRRPSFANALMHR